ncbi:MAG: phosphate acyltransferase, partial [Marinicaulis sp.]|nr:phosphate acyltransferase [Marinicaulis sp.]
MKKAAKNEAPITLAIDAMGGDTGPQAVVDGVALAVRHGLKAHFLFFGAEAQLRPLLLEAGLTKNAEIRHADNVVAMTDKPSHVIRRGRETSMWFAMMAAKEREADAVVSCGNTGA